MNTWAVLATGPSLTPSVVESVRGRCNAVAVSDAFKLAPWADALASTDGKWWQTHTAAMEFAGRKFTLAPSFVKLDGIERLPGNAVNSGLLAVMVAVHLGAKRVLLCGLDMRSPGDHFFGKHPAPLKSTTQEVMETFKKQFKGYRPRGVDIINCTPGSGLKCYPFAGLNACLPEPAIHGQ